MKFAFYLQAWHWARKNGMDSKEFATRIKRVSLQEWVL